MTRNKIVAFHYFLFIIAFTEVASWTIDLPEVRKYYFSHNKGDNVINVDGKQSYDNINGNSLHNTDDYHYKQFINDPKLLDENREGYADGYKYQGYMEKQVHEVVRKGSAYLDGLRRSLEQYMELLENCSRTNFTDQVNNTIATTTSPMEQSSTPAGNFSELLTNFTGTKDWMTRCRNATKKSEYVRRMVDLALWATRRLEDRAYAARYHKDYEKEENELLLRLSYYIEQIARYTGYQPNVEEFVTEPTTRAPTSPATITLPFDNVPREIVNNTMTCLDLKNKTTPSQPATVRCAFPLPLPDIVQQMINGGTTTMAPEASELQVMSLSNDNSDSIADQSSLELLITADTRTAENLPPKRTPVNLENDLTAVKSVHKRSIDESEDPLIKIMKYYAKYKVWVNSNPLTENEKNTDNLDVSNNLRRQKRTIFKKNIHLRLPEKPLKALKDHIMHKAGIHFVNNKIQADLIKETINKMRHSTSLTFKHNLDKVFKKVSKRSVHYRNLYKPRESQNPFQDISYYAKNKPGTNYNRDPVQAAQVRLGLEQIFQTGNIEVVRRYGSNFNPLDPNPFYTGLLRTMSDI